MGTAVERANGLTARWARTIGDASTVLSGAGVWPLLAALTGGADGHGLRELSAAVGLGRDEALPGARELFGALDGSADVRAALGLWVHDKVRLRAEWSDGLPPASRGRLSGDVGADQTALDAWVADRTRGILRRMPLSLTEETVLVLASALSVRTGWVEPFDDRTLRIDGGPWAGRVAGLTRTTGEPGQVRIARTPAGPVTMLRVVGRGDVDVHLLLGEPGRTAGEVLAAGLDVLGPSTAGSAPATPAADRSGGGATPAADGDMVDGGSLPEGATGPGLRVTATPSFDDAPRLSVRTVRFTVGAEHDLMDSAELFGLRAVREPVPGHFPGVSPDPIAVQQARQDATATFSATGFEAAAITAMGMMAAGMPLNHARTVEVVFDRPFGFAAVHRDSGLIVVAGWVAEPEPLP